MKLFKVVKFQLKVDPIAWGYKPFRVLLERDKTKEKEVAFNEMLYIYSFADLRSDFSYITDEIERTTEIVKTLDLPKNWVPDQDIENAVAFYRERSRTVTGELYEAANKAASDISTYLKNTKELLAERDDKGKPVNTVSNITSALKQIPGIMKDLNTAYKELIKEQKDLEGRSKGSKEFNMYEDGL